MKPLLLLFLLAGPSGAAPPLLLSESEGTAPLSVKVQGPPVLLRKAESCEFGIGGTGFWVDWGDGSKPLVDRTHPDCAMLLEHTYTVAGDYVVKAQASHPGSTDKEVVDWSGEAHLKVNGGSAVKPRLQLLDKLAGKVVHYGEGFPAVRYRVETSRKVELEAELVGGKISLFRMRKSVGSSGEDVIEFPGYGNGPAAEAYSAGKARVRLRLRLLDGAKEVAQTESPPFDLRADAVFRELRVESGKGRMVTASVDVHHLDCYSAIVDWGDGGAPERSPGFEVRKQCPLRTGPYELTHQYGKPGRYRIRWHDNDGDPFHEAELGLGYMEREIRAGN